MYIQIIEKQIKNIKYILFAINYAIYNTTCVIYTILNINTIHIFIL
jgi:hypothetical protein